MRSLSVVPVLACAAGVFGHGYVQQLKIGSQYVQAWNPYKDPQQHVVRITRTFKDNGPIPDNEFTTSAITCNVGLTSATQNVPVNATAVVPAGTTVQFLWTDWQSDHPGPIMTYLAKCPGPCSTYKADSGKIWVKIQEDGYDAKQAIPWASKRLPTVNSTWSATIPKTLQNGEYILRHEILGLQRATELGRAQFYPACHQITVTGGGTKALPAGIALPGDYTLTDPGIYLQYRNISATNPYTPPGGRPWTG
ncbi:Esterase/lipase/thioesterase [Ceratobasidium sp. 394]|nr:Esterase/lipase/thioesterase [Ceratobasidium sp. 394]